MTPQPEKQTIAMPQYITQYLKKLKFQQLIKHNLRNVFLEKTYTKYGGETSSIPFSRNQN